MTPQTSHEAEDRLIGSLVKVAISLLLMVLVMLWAWNAFSPSGARKDFLDFSLFFARELLLIVPFILVTAVITLIAAWRFCARWLKRRGRSSGN